MIEEKELLEKADLMISNSLYNINKELIILYWNLGKMIYKYKALEKTVYGNQTIKNMSDKLTKKYGSGFDYTNIHRMLKFYETFTILNGQEKVDARQLFEKYKNLNWSHVRELLKLNSSNKLQYYLQEIESKSLSSRELIRTIKMYSYERTLSNQKKIIRHEVEKNIKYPIILNIENKKRTEKELEEDILSNIFNFMSEIGTEVALLGRQYKLNIRGLVHKVDLVFIDTKLDTYILVDLKIGKVKNKDVHQMQMYIEYFNKEKIKGNFNTIGLILCETNDFRTIDHDDIYKIKYLNEMPKENELLQIIEQNKIILLNTEKLKL